MKQRILDLKNGIGQCLKNFPVETALGVIFFILYIIDDTNKSYYQQIYEQEIQGGSSALAEYNNHIKNVLFLFPSLFVLVYWCRTFFKKKYLYYLSSLVFIPLLFASLDSFLFSIGYGFTLLLSFFLLLIDRQNKENLPFSRNVFQTLWHLGLSVLFGLLFYFACVLIYISVIFIFGLHDTWEAIQYAGIFDCFLISPLLFCYLQEKKQENWQPGKFIEIVLNFILSPAVIIYTGILYLYFITIAWHGELPKGGIAYMVLAFVITALGGRMAQLIVSKRYYDWFYNHFSFIALPPLIIFWIGTIERICTYSWTESRVYLFAAGILMTLYMLFLLFKRLGNYRLMLLISSACIFLLTFIPYISAKDLGVLAQRNRLEHLAKALNLWDDKEHKVKETEDIFKADYSEDIKNCKQLAECFNYLRITLGKEEVTRLYGSSNFTFATPELKKKETSVRITNTSPIAIPEGYRFCSELSNNTSYVLSTSNDSIAYVKNRDTKKIVLSFNMEKQFGPHLKEILSWEKDSVHDLSPFFVKNDSCMLVLRSIKYDIENKQFSCREHTGLLFLK